MDWSHSGYAGTGNGRPGRLGFSGVSDRSGCGGWSLPTLLSAESELYGFCGAGRTGVAGSSSVASSTAETDPTARGSTNFE